MPNSGHYPGLGGLVIIGGAAVLWLLVFLLAALAAVLVATSASKPRRRERFGAIFLRFSGGPLAALVLSGSAFAWACVATDGDYVDEVSVPVLVLTLAIGIILTFLFRRMFPPPWREAARPSGQGPATSEGDGGSPRLERERR